MNTIPQNISYYPHNLNTKFYAVRLYSKDYPLSLVCRRYHISKSSLEVNVKGLVLLFFLNSFKSTFLSPFTVIK